jgi:hypothetical protein
MHVASGFRLRAKRFGETRRSLGGGGQPEVSAQSKPQANKVTTHLASIFPPPRYIPLLYKQTIL